MRLDESVLAPCGDPRTHLGAGDWELIAGRIGDDLILCGKNHAALTDWARGTISARAGK